MQEILDIFLTNPVGQTFGLLGMVSVAYAFLQKEDKKVFEILIYAHFFWIAHFYFMDLYAGLAAASIGLIRLLASIKYKKNLPLFSFFFTIVIISGIYTYEDSSSIIPIVASLLSTYGYFFLEKVRLRLLILVISAFWLSYHYIHFSIGGVLTEILVQFINLYIIYSVILAEGKFGYYFSRIRRVISYRPKIDYGRYLTIIDYINFRKKRRK